MSPGVNNLHYESHSFAPDLLNSRVTVEKVWLGHKILKIFLKDKWPHTTSPCRMYPLFVGCVLGRGEEVNDVSVFCSGAFPSEKGHAIHTLLSTVFKPYWDHSCLIDKECWCKQHCCYFRPEEEFVRLKACLFFPNCNSWSNKRYCLSLKTLNCITLPLFCRVWIRL